MKYVKRKLQNFDITIHMTDCHKKANRIIKTEMGGKEPDCFEEEDSGMVVFFFKARTGIICVSDSRLSTLCHEIIHAVDYIAQCLGGDIHADSEPYAYTGDYIYKEFIENIWGIEDAQA